jgi:hypothetical protein
LQDRRVEALGEPAIDRREETTGFSALALIAPEAGEAHASTQLQEFRGLPPRYGERLMTKPPLRSTSSVQQR